MYLPEAYNLNTTYKYEAIRETNGMLRVFCLAAHRSRPTDHPNVKPTLVILGNKSLTPLATGD